MCDLFANVLDFKTVSLKFDNSELLDINDVSIKNGDKLLTISNRSFNSENSVLIFLNEVINIKEQCFIIYKNHQITASYYKLFASSQFNNRYYYDGDLGLYYTQEYSTFTLWSPAAKSVNLLIYENGDTSIYETPQEFKMEEIDSVWTITIPNDLKGKFYNYKVTVYGNTNIVIDPYAKTVGVNGLRGAIIDLKESNPPNWNNDNFVKLSNYTDAIIYEANIRDISSSPTSNIKNKGKFLGLTEENTHSNSGLTTGLSHIKELGITHLQLMPFFDYSYISVDEKNPLNYNWGYDPQNYNVPEGSYSSNAYNPMCRIFELKKLIQKLHENNIGINMDVVFNHMFHKHFINFERIFPFYYFRYDENNKLSNGSGCSNDVASEHKMVQKFILDSVIYWATEYHIDGFRFDLMGLHDVDTMNLIISKLKEINKNAIVYGEGWNLETTLPKENRTIQENSIKTPQIGFFNDTIRDSLKGSIFSSKDNGFVNGKENLEDLIKFCTMGCALDYNNFKAIYKSPSQSINYVSCHDNHTLWDKLQLTNPDDSIKDKKSMVKLALGILLCSQGVPFIHCGAEFCRTKQGISNSFNLPDEINSIDYNRKSQFEDVFYYIKSLINLRKNHPAFRMALKEDINLNLEFIEDTPKNTVAFLLKNNANNDDFKTILVVYNSNIYNVDINIPQGTWNQIVNKYSVDKNIISTITSNKVNIEPISLNIYLKKSN
ncbi:type I pullulanase [Clostridium novyi]|uniref:Pullulanase, type I n=1 Tax=Clostridium novyi (strain NT) TaxID=386415 RepID=A0Q2Q8_CLONN|nr:type I pullulanase [Clostridium novyi]ABK62454.1 pullulanase, type I [Clostridium novyi NT]KEH85770.1 pullulanase [Clostridium novyi A str. NCTC 538]